MTTLSARDNETVKEFVLEQVQDYLNAMILNDPNNEEQDTVSGIYGSIEQGHMLDKEEAKYLQDTILLPAMEGGIASLARYEGWDVFSRLEDLSIYVDAYYLYCRPGTYTG
jgi:hypothetical protein